ncbi:MAG: hypothetical protein ACYCDZ_11015 [Enterococcus hirae]
MLSSKELKQQAKDSLKGGWLPVKWTRKYNKIFRELFANFVANNSSSYFRKSSLIVEELLLERRLARGREKSDLT